MRAFRPLLAAVPLAVALAAGAAAKTGDLKTLVLGKGPTIVLVHELGAGRMVWMPVARRLLADHRVVLLDLPGHGESPMLDPFSLDAAAGALGRLLAGLPAESTVVVGHGVGGLVALLEARASPARTRGLVLMGAAPRLGDIPDQQRKRFMESLDARYDGFLRSLFTRLGRDSAQGVALHAQAAAVPKATMMAYLRELLYADASAAAKHVKVPVLYLDGDRNWPAAKDWPTRAKELGLDALPAASGRRIGASGHYVMSDQPDSLAAALAEFTARALEKK